jgi:anti-sigma factor RsiW
MMMTCKNCQYHMTAYLDGELSPPARQRMTQHIQVCPVCYTVHSQQRDLQRDLAYDVPLIGQENRPRYDKMWASIQADMSRPKQPRYQMRYGLAALMLLVALLLPWTIGRQSKALAALPTQPSPELTATRTPGVAGARIMGTLASVLYSSIGTPEAAPQLVRAPGAPDGTP